MIGIGVDTGGTYTDVVVYDFDTRKVLCSGKTPTTRENLEIGILRGLDMMDRELLKKAELLALSTTLATNASLENKGGRAKCLMIGCNPDSMANLESVYAKYGMQDLNQLVFVDGRPEHFFSNPMEPDWEMIRTNAADWFAGCKSVGITQIYPRADGGKLERKSKEVLEETLGIPVTTAHDMFEDVDVLKRGAGTLLNARLIPLIDEFLIAVRHALKARNLHMPIAIVKSDGSLLTEELVRELPVETLLSGPAASTIGGSVLAGEENAIIVDMGGTTTDIALIRDKNPILASDGITIGPWKTTVKGLYVNTCLLGGDSAVRFKDFDIMLCEDRVVPLSVLAGRYPQVIQKLKWLAESKRTHTRMISDFWVLQKNLADGTHTERMENYSEKEQKVIRLLQDGPLMIEELAEQMDSSIYQLKIDRLEAEGIVMRSGLTPTDMMIRKGDLDPDVMDEPVNRSGKAVQYAMEFLGRTTGTKPEAIPDLVYKLVMKKMYCRIAEILLDRKYPKKKRLLSQEGVKALLEWSFEEAFEKANDAGGKKPDWMEIRLETDLPIIGVGAPTHVFLSKVAGLLGTRAVINRYASVANALGAIAGQVVLREKARVKAEFQGATPNGYSVYDGEERLMFEEYPDAEKYAVEMTVRKVREKAAKHRADPNAEVKTTKEQIRTQFAFFETIVESTITDVFHI
ncbi:MAG: hydantoinase/oxoprolinase family protein [Eubacteriales bacterium]|nr:hydantoinase/oxoprolinase family protein [Eubacteriales bacterium]